MSNDHAGSRQTAPAPGAHALAHLDAPELLRPALTKIVATIGPASSDHDTVSKLIEAGASVFRLNFSHGTFADHEQRVQAIRRAAGKLGQPVAILGDLQGPKVRVGAVAWGGVTISAGQVVRFGCANGEEARPAPPGELQTFSCTYAGLADDVQPGQRLLVNDGAVRMLIVARRGDQIECVVTPGGGGQITSGKGINLPDSTLRLASITEHDWECVRWGERQEVDYLALSFVRRADDLAQLRAGLTRGARDGPGPGAPSIIAKIETPAAVAHIDDILEAADAIMVARGDLGVEMDLARVPVVQKQLVAAADRHGKPCIVATQMLESMIHQPTPTRAEASDVANAILDGADAVMLSGETAIGKYPVLAVQSMRRIAHFTEAHVATLPPRSSPPQKLVESRYRTAALAHGVWTIAQDIAAKFIVVWSQQGGGARYLSQNSFTIPILAATSDDRAARRMQLLRSVTPVVMPQPESLPHFTRIVDEYLMATGWAHAGDPCILVAGGPIGQQGVTNSLAIHSIGDPRSGFAQQ